MLASPLARIVHAVIAVVAFSGVATGWFLEWQAGGDPLEVALLQFQFFTHLSNVLVIITSAQLALARDWERTWHPLRIAGILCIIITGLVFNLVLKGGDPIGWWAYNNAVVHVVIPIAAPLAWVIFGPRATTWRRLLLATIAPVIWAISTMVRGAIIGWYPYFILDPAVLGVGVVVGVIVGILAGFCVVGALMVLVDRVVGQPRSAGASATSSDGSSASAAESHDNSIDPKNPDDSPLGE